MRTVCIYRKTALWRYRKTKGIHWIICKKCWREIGRKDLEMPHLNFADTCQRVLHIERMKQNMKEALP